jgi:hypothetical protein
MEGGVVGHTFERAPSKDHLRQVQWFARRRWESLRHRQGQMTDTK